MLKFSEIPILKEFEWFEWFEWFGPSPIEPFNSVQDPAPIDGARNVHVGVAALGEGLGNGAVGPGQACEQGHD